MGADANLGEALRLATAIVDDEDMPDDACRLAELFLALDQWITGGGFLPARWSQK